MEIQQDFKDLLELFNAHKVEYIIVGGYALAFHGVPRYTGDIDIFVKPDDENATRIMSALEILRGRGKSCSLACRRSELTSLHQ
jgi:hypothetical protein